MREMKYSGIGWVSDIPSNWEVKRSKYCFNHTKQIAGSNADDYERLALTMNGVIKRSKDDNNGLQPEQFETYQVLKIDQLVFKLIDLQNISTSRVGLSPYLGLVSPAYIVLNVDKSKVCPKFAEQYFLMLWRNQVFNALGDAGVRSSLNATELLELPIVLPPLSEQKRIADYLDGKCAEIDGLVADIQSQIDTLEQYKRSVITETVTKGLNPDAEMKDSGIDGTGKIPSHWGMTRMCYECYIRARLGWRGLKADEYVDEGYAFISAFNIQNGKLVWTPLNYITKERFDESPEIKLHSGDVLIVKDGAGVGKCARVDDLPMGGTAPNSSIAVITPSKNLDYRYVCYYLQSAVFNNFVLLLYNGMGVPHLTQEAMSKIKILVPPLKEQIIISDYLDAKCTEIDTIIDQKKEQISTLESYKKSLIYEYVTGKKEVPV